MQCPGCGITTRVGARFCERCRAELPRTCSSCGSEVGWTAKFCGACGASLDAASAAVPPSASPGSPTLDAERRQLTVLFCDLVGSTALAGRLDPEELRELMQAYQRACRDVIARYEGHVARVFGRWADGLFWLAVGA